MANTDIPSFNDICGTVTQSLAETILNREAVIAQLRDELARTKDLLRERSTNYGELAKQNRELRAERDEARRDYCEYVAEDRRQGLVGHEDCTPDAVAMDMGWSVFANDTHTPSIFESRRTRRSDFTQQQSDSDPVTGVQYGDLV